MLNVILLCLLLGVIGAAYVWLGDKTKTRAELILETNRQIADVERRIKAVDQKLKSSLTDAELRSMADRTAGDLLDIVKAPKGTVIILPSPGVSGVDLNPLASADSL